MKAKSLYNSDNLFLMNIMAPEVGRRLYIGDQLPDSLGDYDVLMISGAILSSTELEAFNKQSFYYINNSDKTMRWVYPADLSHPTFLNFYNAATFKAKVFCWLTKLAFLIGFRSWFTSGSFTIFHKGELKLKELAKKKDCDNFSVFMGTVGPNRKLLVELNSKGKSRYFIKKALNEKSQKLVNNEVDKLQALKNNTWKHLSVPQAEKLPDTSMGLLSNIQTDRAVRSIKLTETHIKALSELYDYSFQKQAWQELPIYEQTSTNINRLDFKDEHLVIRRLATLLETLNSNLDSAVLSTAYSHGDFTPWNMYVEGDQLHLYDWELAFDQMPLLFDLFHFIFQTGVLLTNANYSQIKKQINDLLTWPSVKALIGKYEIDVEKHYQLYLLINVSYYVNIYQQQEKLHEQAHWLLEVWEAALTDVLIQSTKESRRKIFISNYFNKIAGQDYAVLKFKERDIDQIAESSDIDILIKKSDLKSMLTWIKGISSISKVEEVHFSFMTQLDIYFDDASFLSIDLIHQFKRKDQEFMSANEVLKNTELTAQGIKVPNLVNDFEYCLLFYFLNGSPIPQKYLDWFAKDEIRLLAYLEKKYEVNLDKIQELSSFSETLKKQLIKKVKHTEGSMGSLLNKMAYYKDTLKRVSFKKGMIITFSGVDGAGKSTIINELQSILVRKYRKQVVVIRHRPSLLPILSSYKYGKKEAERRTTLKLPRQGNNKSSLSSMIRFGYYYLDYLFGQVYIYGKYVLRGKIVLYDRYYFDFINDAKRSNIQVNKGLAKSLYRFIYKPQLNFFLFAPTNVILSRKKELQAHEIEELTNAYLELFKDFNQKYDNSQYTSILNIDKEETFNQIIRQITNN